MDKPNLFILKVFIDLVCFDGKIRDLEIDWSYHAVREFACCYRASGNIIVSWKRVRKLKKEEMLSFVAGLILHELVHAYMFLYRSKKLIDNIGHKREYKSILFKRVKYLKSIKLNWPVEYVDKDFKKPEVLVPTHFFQCTLCGGMRNSTISQNPNSNIVRSKHYGCESLKNWQNVQDAEMRKFMKLKKADRDALLKLGKQKPTGRKNKKSFSDFFFLIFYCY